MDEGVDRQHAERGAIWDLDGVLVDTADLHRRAWAALAEESGLVFTDEDFRRTFGLRNPEIIATVFGQALPPERVQALGDRKEELFRSLARGHIRPLPGALELLEGLARAGVRQALATSTPRANVHLVLEELGLEDRFDAVVCAEDVRAGKPDPEGFLLAARRLGVDPRHCVVLEDAVAGAQAARAAGMGCVAVAGQRPLEQLAQSLPPSCLVVRTLLDLTPEQVIALAGRRGGPAA